MGGTAHIGGRIEIWRDGKQMPDPPNRSVAVLLIGLIERGESWSGRDELAQRMYPGESQNKANAALRQSITRIRRWLGNDVIESGDARVRLKDSWELDLNFAHGEPATGQRIAPGIRHPWLEEMRLQWSPAPAIPEVRFSQAFAEAVEELSKVDPDTARSTLVGGAALLGILPTTTVARLLGLTHPTDRRDPFSFEQIELETLLLTRMGDLAGAMAAGLRAFRMATHQRSMSLIDRGIAGMLFASIEAGQMSEAKGWLDRIPETERIGKTRLLLSNARAAYAWNQIQFDEALELMKRAERFVTAAERAERLHFWSNYFVLAAEAGRQDQAQECEQRVRELIRCQIDLAACHCLELGLAELDLLAGQSEEAVKRMRSLVESAGRSEHELTSWYAQELLAEALCRAGNPSEGLSVWGAVETKRLRHGLRLTPRLRARKSRIMANMA